jgi:cytochrome c553
VRARRTAALAGRFALLAMVALFTLLPPLRVLAAMAAPAGDAGDAGASIYLRGLTGSGKPLAASREAGSHVMGAAAACVNCHRRSGFGGKEGRTTVPPVTGRYLYRPLPVDGDDRGLPFLEGMRGDRAPYTDATLARAIRKGMDAQGRPLGYLMPRYALGDADMAALIAYLKGLDQEQVPGVTATTLHFATIITPDADPVKRQGMLDVFRQFFADRNVRQMVPVPPMLASGKTAYSRTMFMVHRRWELHVWELTGPEATWREQLERRLAAEPVFAVISGLGGRTWAPVHEFCVHAALPCLFPNVDAPPADADHDVYSIYYSRGVLLEADLIAKGIVESSGGVTAKRAVQVYRAGDSGEAGAARLGTALKQQGIAVSDVVIAHDAPAAAARDALRGPGGSADAVVLWLRGPDLAALTDSPPAGTAVFFSGLLGGLERAPVPAAWRANAKMAMPFDLPDRRRVRVDYALGWIHGRRIPVVAEQVQTDTYLALGLVAETIKHMVDNFVRDYLVERMEDTIEHRIITGYYPRLSLSTGQRYASKGGYLVRFTEPQGPRLAAVQDWSAP